MKKFFLLCLTLFFCGGSGLCLAGEYVNERYGFAVNWMDPAAGAFAVTESENGDGVTVTDPMHAERGMEMRAWGSMGWSVMGMDFESGLREVCGRFSHIDLKRVNREEGWFILSGSAENAILHVKGYYTPEAVCLLSLRYNQEQREIFDDAFAQDVVRSFRKLSATGAPVFLPSGMHLLRVGVEGDAVDEHGCHSFLFTAEENLNFFIRQAEWDDKACTLNPGEIIRKIVLKEGEACRVRFLVPEGIPVIMICADAICVTPAFSGMDGSLILGPGFVEAAPNAPPAPVMADIHYVYGNEGIREIK